MNRSSKWLRRALLCIAGLFLLICLSVFSSSIHVSGNGIFFKISCAVFGACAFCCAVYIFMGLSDLSKRKKEEDSNFILKFPKNPSPSWTTFDSVLADLVYDYGLGNYEVEQIARSGVHDAVAQYRKAHPLDHTPSEDLFDTVFPYE